MAFSTILYKYATVAWFQQDDFAWLGLRLQVHSWRDFLRIMFVPLAQGTIRPISERAFYMAFFSWFDLNALPYRALVYVTQLGNIALLSVVSYSLMKSYTASFVAPVLWVANIALALPMTWTAAYNEILWSFFLLLSFYALLRYTETGAPRFNRLQWTSFLVGFGVLEANVVYPAIATLYAVLFAPKYVKRLSWLFLPSVVFTTIHTAVRTPPKNDVYALHVDGSMIDTLIRYWERALGPHAAAQAIPRIHFYPLILAILLSLAILSFAIVQYRRGDRLPVFFLGWFLIALAPFLPIRNHISDYYLTVPSIGLALVGAWAVVTSAKRSMPYKVVAGLSIAVYLACSIPATRKLSRNIWERSLTVKNLVLGIRAIHEQNPNKMIVLEGVDEALFWNGVYDRPFRLFGANNVYLTPETVQKIPPYPELGNVADYTLPRAEILTGLAQNRIRVYKVEGGQPKDITSLFRGIAAQGAVPRRIELGHPPMESLLGPTWFPSEGDYRWMPKEGSVVIGMPENGAGLLRIEAFCAPVQIQTGPLKVYVLVEGDKSRVAEIRDCGREARLEFPISVPAGARQAEVTVVVDRTIRVPPDERDLGLAIRSIEVVPRP